jgi:hypothetical protein
MLAVNGLGLFIAVTDRSVWTAQDYTLVLFGESIGQIWVVHSGFCPAASFVFSSVAEAGDLGMWKRHPCRWFVRCSRRMQMNENRGEDTASTF